MPTKKYRPYTPSRRTMTTSEFAEITTRAPEKSLLGGKARKGGRNAHGRITSRFRGGGHKRRYRTIDFRRRDKEGVPAKVATVEYDPNRSARIALLHYLDGEKRYILAPDRLTVGTRIVCGPEAEPVVGNALPLRFIPVGAVVHNVEMIPGKGAQLARAAGTRTMAMPSTWTTVARFATSPRTSAATSKASRGCPAASHCCCPGQRARAA